MPSNLTRDGLFKAKYHFKDLTIGESMRVMGKPGNIRSAACMQGTRYGLWLRVRGISANEVEVTRLAAPPSVRRGPRRPTHRERSAQIVQMEREFMEYRVAAKAELSASAAERAVFEEFLKEQRGALRALTLLVIGLRQQLEEQL